MSDVVSGNETTPVKETKPSRSLKDLFRGIFRVNPIIVKEVRSRMRGPRAFITLTVILLGMGGLMYAMLQIILYSTRYTSVLSPQVGQGLFAVLAFMELFMICAITPAVTAGAISSEKEKQTYEMLMATPLSPTSILWGKLISALSYIFLLLFAGIPLASVVFIFGGVALSDMLKVLLVLLMFAVAFGILGLFMSALFGRTGRATVGSFIAVILLMIGPLFLATLVGVLRQSEPPRWLLAPSPISTLSAALAAGMGQNDLGSVFYFLSGFFGMGVSPVSQTSIPRPLYHYSVPFYALVSLILYMLSTRLVQPTRRWRIPKTELAIGIGSLIVLVGLFVGVYFLTAPRYEWAKNPLADPAMQGMTEPAMMGPMGAPAIQKEIQVQAVPAGELTPTPADGAQASPTPTQWADNPVIKEVAEETVQAEIYAAIAQQMFTVDNTFGGKVPGWTHVYLVATTDDAAGGPDNPKGEPVLLPESVQDGVLGRLKEAGLPAEVIWVETREQAPTDSKTGMVKDGKGVIFNFGNIHVQNDGSVHVPASLYFANLGAGGRTYILKKVDGAWVITGTTGVEWIS